MGWGWGMSLDGVTVQGTRAPGFWHKGFGVISQQRGAPVNLTGRNQSRIPRAHAQNSCEFCFEDTLRAVETKLPQSTYALLASFAWGVGILSRKPQS